MSVFGVSLVCIFPHFDSVYSWYLPIQSECGKTRTRKSPKTVTFPVVCIDLGTFVRTSLEDSLWKNLLKYLRIHFHRRATGDCFRVCNVSPLTTSQSWPNMYSVLSFKIELYIYNYNFNRVVKKQELGKSDFRFTITKEEMKKFVGIVSVTDY